MQKYIPAMPLLIRLGLLVSMAHLTGRPGFAQDTGFVTITSDPPGQVVYVDQTRIGITPIDRYALSAGRYEIRILNPNQTDWEMRDWLQEVKITPGETSTIHARFVGIVTVISAPFDADVLVDNVHMGKTPLRLRDLPSGVHTIVVRKTGYKEAQQSVIVRDITNQTLNVTLIPVIQMPRETMIQPDRHTERSTGKLLGFATLGLGLVFSGLALYEDNKADDAYAGYLNTGDPAALERFFQSAERHDKRRSLFVVAAQLNFLGTAYFFISPLFRSDEDSPNILR